MKTPAPTRILIFLLAGGLLLAVGGGLFHVHRLLLAKVAVEPVDLMVEEGRSVRAVLQELEERGLISSAPALRWYLRLLANFATIQAGEYRLEGRLSPLDIFQRLRRGRVKQYAVTLVEGWTFQDIRLRLASAEQLLGATDGLTEAEIMRRLGHPGLSPEGRFFPDTYHYVRDAEDISVLRSALKRMQLVLAEEWRVREPGLPYTVPDEALTLASIVEQETGHPDDRTKIAGVFVRRLQLGIKLQSDPTVIYGLGDEFDGNLTRAHLRAATPWNTYVHKGLPPTPIAAPGRASLQAALHPDTSGYLYFVAKGDGRSVFSSSLREHNAAVRRYQLGLPDDGEGR